MSWEIYTFSKLTCEQLKYDSSLEGFNICVNDMYLNKKDKVFKESRRRAIDKIAQLVLDYNQAIHHVKVSNSSLWDST